MKNILKSIYLFFESVFLKFKWKKDILFVVLNELMFSYALPVYEKIKSDKRLRIKFCFYSDKYYDQKNRQKAVNTYGLSTVSWKTAKYIKWDLIMFPFHGPYFRKDCKKIYIGHGLNSGKLIEGEYAKYDHRSRDADTGGVVYDKIFCCHESEREMTRKEFPDHYPRMRVTGNLLVDDLMTITTKRDNILNTVKLDPKRKTLLMGSTWGPYSFAQNLGAEFVENLDKYLEKFNIIISVHPNNFYEERSPDINWKNLLQKAERENVYCVKRGEETYRYLPAADILLTDHSSIGLFYLFLERPIVYYKNDGIQFENGAHHYEMQKVSYAIRGLKNLEEDIHLAFEQHDPKKKRDAAGKVCSYVKQGWERYREEIYDSLAVNLKN